MRALAGGRERTDRVARQHAFVREGHSRPTHSEQASNKGTYTLGGSRSRGSSLGSSLGSRGRGLGSRGGGLGSWDRVDPLLLIHSLCLNFGFGQLELGGGRGLRTILGSSLGSWGGSFGSWGGGGRGGPFDILSLWDVTEGRRDKGT
jgi:hypothetical protein